MIKISCLVSWFLCLGSNFKQMKVVDIKSSKSPERSAEAEGNFYQPLTNNIGPGMNERVQRLRKQSVETTPFISIERALIETEF